MAMGKVLGWRPRAGCQGFAVNALLEQSFCGGPNRLGRAGVRVAGFVNVQPYVPHQEINASPTEVLECLLRRSDGEAVAVSLDIEAVEQPSTVLWIDPTPHGGV